MRRKLGREAADQVRRAKAAAETGRCWLCPVPLHPVLIEAGYSSHPACDPAEISPLWVPGKMAGEGPRWMAI